MVPTSELPPWTPFTKKVNGTAVMLMRLAICSCWLTRMEAEEAEIAVRSPRGATTVPQPVVNENAPMDKPKDRANDSARRKAPGRSDITCTHPPGGEAAFPKI